ncbi:MAG: tRNA (adenosine(37)-N6)-threonylcarbamoyltransferase complex ATPase subunit type 1 TsaE [Clostridia bacterium]|nr:tRNA (adenosine(37)-N6)-threonylcarbamoyltransferase complex ATPase subunit type 1 TsaE [Clostridia bacterium]
MVGANFAMALYNGGVKRAFISLCGEMGVGKTAFARGFCRALGAGGVHSPTYTVVNEYRDGKLPVYHFDLYRLESEEDLTSVGYDDYLNKDGFILCEWSERIPEAVPQGAIKVTFRRLDDENGREIVIEGEF